MEDISVNLHCDVSENSTIKGERRRGHHSDFTHTKVDHVWWRWIPARGTGFCVCVIPPHLPGRRNQWSLCVKRRRVRVDQAPSAVCMHGRHFVTLPLLTHSPYKPEDPLMSRHATSVTVSLSLKLHIDRPLSFGCSFFTHCAPLLALISPHPPTPSASFSSCDGGGAGGGSKVEEESICVKSVTGTHVFLADKNSHPINCYT